MPETCFGYIYPEIDSLLSRRQIEEILDEKLKKNEVILNGKLHFLCSALSKTTYPQIF